MPNDLKLQQGQRMVLTPQLQQAIEVLGLSSAELLDEIHRVSDDNPFLEVTEPQAQEEHADPVQEPVRKPDARVIQSSDDAGGNPEGDFSPAHDSFGELNFSQASWGHGDPNTDTSPLDWVETSETLQEHLEAQIPFLREPPEVKEKVSYLVGELDENGLFETPLEEMADSFARQTGSDPADFGAWHRALLALQSLDPAGIGVYSVSESLALQLKLLGESVPDLPPRPISLAETALTGSLGALAHKDYAKLKRTLSCTDDELKSVYRIIQSLNPHPASDFKNDAVQYAVPDILVTRKNGVWTAALNPASTPALSLNPQLADLASSAAKKSPAETPWREKAAQAKVFIRSVEQRYSTMLRVAQSIVNRQQAFFSSGEKALTPMVLKDIAADTGLHESTISRATNGKYLQSPAGIFELKYFFSSHVAAESGDAVSSKAIRSLIRALIAEEPAAKPLSDAKLSELLKEKGYQVARRTVAKYREQEKILPASLRKKI